MPVGIWAGVCVSQEVGNPTPCNRWQVSCLHMLFIDWTWLSPLCVLFPLSTQSPSVYSVALAPPWLHCRHSSYWFLHCNDFKLLSLLALHLNGHADFFHQQWAVKLSRKHFVAKAVLLSSAPPSGPPPAHPLPCLLDGLQGEGFLPKSALHLLKRFPAGLCPTIKRT